MIKPLYYCILKNYHGVFKKKYSGNTHLFFIPRKEDDYLYLALLGKVIDEENTYTCSLVTRVPDEYLEPLLTGEEEYFGERFEIVDNFPVKTTVKSPGKYYVKKMSKSEYILSDLILVFEPEFSSSKRKIYTLKGKLNLQEKEIENDKLALSTISTKKLAFLHNKNRISFL